MAIHLKGAPKAPSAPPRRAPRQCGPMKLATYKDGSRDGQLVVVSRDLSSAHFATGIASRLQQVLDDWNFLSPQLQDLYVTLNQGRARHAFAFEPRQCMAPLPRAGQWLVLDQAAPAAGAVGAAHASAGADPGRAGAADPHGGDGGDGSGVAPATLRQGASDDFLGPCDDAWFGSAAWGIGLAPGPVALVADLAMGASPAQGLDSVRLLLLANPWRLQRPPLPAAGDGLCSDLAAWPAAAFAPVAVTPDELGEAWHGGPRAAAPAHPRERPPAAAGRGPARRAAEPGRAAVSAPP